MARHTELGNKGEQIALEYLVNSGYQILEKNWRFNKKEIDLIARKGDLIIIVEVKTRSTDYFGQPEEFVTRSKQKHLINAANAYLQNLTFEAEVRYDIMSVLKRNNTFKVKHIEDAFIPYLNI